MNSNNNKYNKIVSEFLQFYFININKYNWSNLETLLKSHSVINFDNEEVKGINNIKYFFLNIFSKNIKFNFNKLSFTKCGTRRFNILISGNIINPNNNIIKYTQYFFLALGNDKKYWLNTSILQTF